MNMDESISFGDSRTFDIGHWQALIIFALSDFRDFSAVAQDEEVIGAHADKRRVIHFNENGESRADNDPKTREWVRQEVLESVTRSRSTHLQLLLVYIMAVLERILDDFLIVSFSTHPEWMHDYLRSAAESEMKGVVGLKDVISTSSREELVRTLARRATDNANRGTFRDRLKRIERMTGFSFPAKRREELMAFSSRRNRLVHELRLDPVSEEEVEEAFVLALKLLEDLGRAAQRSSIDYNDPANLLG